MGCNLDKFTSYTVAQVVHDNADGRITVRLSDAPDSCPDKSFTTHKGEIAIQAGVGPILTFDQVKNHPIVIVPRKELVNEVEHSGSFFTVIFVLFVIAAILYGVYRLMLHAADVDIGAGDDDDGGGGKRKPSPLSADEVAGPTCTVQATPAYNTSEKAFRDKQAWRTPIGNPKQGYSEQSNPNPAPSHTTVINNNTGGGFDLGSAVVGALAAESLSSPRERVEAIERPVVREFPAQAPTLPTDHAPDNDPSMDFSSDTAENTVSSDSEESTMSSDSESTMSSDSDDSSMSSDSGSDYSSDDSSSSSSDSGSDYSSDSSSSFGDD